MPGWTEKLKKAWSFFERDVWEIEPRNLTRGRLFLLRQAQLAALVARDFFDDRCLLRASALTYTTLLSIVPLLALAFSVLKGMGVQNVLEPIILENIAMGSEEIISQIITYINNTNVGRLGAAGLIVLIFTVLTLLTNIEESFNFIWGVRETRPLLRRFADYFSVVIFGPIFLLAAVSMTTGLESQILIQKLLELAVIGKVLYLLFQILPFVAMWAAFTFLYLYMPNVKVSLRAALVGGIFGGTLWQAGQWAYVHFQFGVARYNAIYGTLAALPIFMVWIYLSWVIVLLGLEVAYAVQNLRTLRREIRSEKVNFATRELVAMTVLLVVAEAFYRGERPWGQEKIATALELPPRLSHRVLADLTRLGFLSEVRDGEGEDVAYQPGCAPDTLELFTVVQALREDGVSYTRMRKTPEREAMQELESQLQQAGRRALEGATLHDLVQKMAARRKEGRHGAAGVRSAPT